MQLKFMSMAESPVFLAPWNGSRLPSKTKQNCQCFRIHKEAPKQ